MSALQPFSSLSHCKLLSVRPFCLDQLKNHSPEYDILLFIHQFRFNNHQQSSSGLQLQTNNWSTLHYIPHQPLIRSTSTTYILHHCFLSQLHTSQSPWSLSISISKTIHLLHITILVSLYDHLSLKNHSWLCAFINRIQFLPIKQMRDWSILFQSSTSKASWPSLQPSPSHVSLLLISRFLLAFGWDHFY